MSDIPFIVETPEKEFSGELVYNMPEKEYHEKEDIGSTDVKTMIKSMADYLYQVLNPLERRPEWDVGSAFHLKNLEPHLYSTKVDIFIPKKAVKTRGKEINEYAKAHPDKYVITENEHAMIQAMSESMHAHPRISQIFSSFQSEVSMFWKDFDTGLDCKGRLDMLLPDHWAIDLKTCQKGDAHPDDSWNTMKKWGYDVQKAFYCDGYKACTGKELNGFLFVMVEKAEPYNVGIYELGFSKSEQGRYKYKKGLQKYSDYLESGEQIYSGYSENIETIL